MISYIFGYVRHFPKKTSEVREFRTLTQNEIFSFGKCDYVMCSFINLLFVSEDVYLHVSNSFLIIYKLYYVIFCVYKSLAILCITFAYTARYINLCNYIWECIKKFQA